MSTEPISQANLKIEFKNDFLSLYALCAKTAKHHFCKRCGIYTFLKTLSQPGFYRINIDFIN